MGKKKSPTNREVTEAVPPVGMIEGYCYYCENNEFAISQIPPSMKWVVLKCVTCGATYEFERTDVRCASKDVAFAVPIEKGAD